MKFQSNVFDDLRNKFVSAHCIMTSNDLTVKPTKTMYISNLASLTYQVTSEWPLGHTYH